MKRIIPFIVAVVALAILAMSITNSPIGEVIETWETANNSFKLRVVQHAEGFGYFGPIRGAYYVFQSAPAGSDDWKEIMTFRHDDPVPVPSEQVRFVSDQVGYVFMGWMYAVTTDGGATWNVWNAEKDLPGWRCCHYGLIENISLESNGRGLMNLHVKDVRRGEVPMLHTEDYGRYWSLR